MMMRLDDLRNISQQDLAALGLDSVAYMRTGEDGVSLFAADGTPVATVPDQQDAKYTLNENQLHLVSLH